MDLDIVWYNSRIRNKAFFDWTWHEIKTLAAVLPWGIRIDEENTSVFTREFFDDDDDDDGCDCYSHGVWNSTSIWTNYNRKDWTYSRVLVLHTPTRQESTKPIPTGWKSCLSAWPVTAVYYSLPDKVNRLLSLGVFSTLWDQWKKYTLIHVCRCGCVYTP